MDINLHQTKLALPEILWVLIVLDCTLRNVKTESSVKLTRPAMVWRYFLVEAILWFNGMCSQLAVAMFLTEVYKFTAANYFIGSNIIRF